MPETNESTPLLFFSANPALNRLLTEALNAPGYYSVLPRAILSGEAPFATLYAALSHAGSSAGSLTPMRRRGRPPGSGLYPTAAALLSAIRPIVATLRNEGRHPSEERVAMALGGTNADPARQLRAWLHSWHISWSDVIGEP